MGCGLSTSIKGVSLPQLVAGKHLDLQGSPSSTASGSFRSPRAPEWLQVLDSLKAAIEATEGGAPAIWPVPFDHDYHGAIASETQRLDLWEEIALSVPGSSEREVVQQALRRLAEGLHRPLQEQWMELVQAFKAAQMETNRAIEHSVYDDAGVAFSPAAPLSWSQACQSLQAVAEAPRDEADGRPLPWWSEDTGAHNDQAMEVRQKMMKLQRTLFQAAFIVLKALVSEDLLLVLREIVLEGRSHADPTPFGSFDIPSEAASQRVSAGDIQDFYKKALGGFELGGISFRVIGSEGAWRTVISETQPAEPLQWTPSPLLFATLEGWGLRLFAVPKLLMPLPRTLSGAAECSLVKRHLLGLGLSVLPDDKVLKDWCIKLPNPRCLQSLEEPLRDCLAARAPPATPAAAVVFTSEDFTAQSARYPKLIWGSTRAAVLEKVAAALGCHVQALLCWEEAKGSTTCEVFGHLGQVWLCPEQSSRSSVWSWGSNRFAVVYAHRAAPPSPPRDLRRALQLLEESLGRCQHPWAVPSALRSCGLPESWAISLAEPGLLAPRSETSSKPSALVEEAVGCHLVAKAAGDTARLLLAAQLRPSSSKEDSLKAPAHSILKLISPSQSDEASTSTSQAASESPTPNTFDEAELQASKGDGPSPSPPLRARRPSHLPQTLLKQPWAAVDGPGHGLQSSKGVSQLWAEEADLHLRALIPSCRQLGSEGGGKLEESRIEMALALRMGLVEVAFWVQVVSSWSQILPENPNRAEKKGEKGHEMSEPLSKLGVRLLDAACQNPYALALAVASQLKVSLVPALLLKLQSRPTARSWPMLEQKVELAEGSVQSPSQLRRPELITTCITSARGPLGGAEEMASWMYRGLRAEAQSSLSLSAQLAAELVLGGDVCLGTAWRRWKPEPELPWQPPAEESAGGAASSPAASSSAQEAVTSSASFSKALLWAAGLRCRLEGPVGDPRAGELRAQYLLRLVEWLLLARVGEVYGGSGDQYRDAPTPSSQASLDSDLKQALVAAHHILVTATSLLLECKEHEPLQLFVALHTLLGYVFEKQGSGMLTKSEAEYRKALDKLHQAWGNPVSQGVRGHPFGLFLTWKLGHISFLSEDAAGVERYGDAFRALRKSYWADNPFTWCPPTMPNGVSWSEGDALAATEASLWQGKETLRTWWQRHSVLNLGTPPELLRSCPCRGSHGAPACGESEWPSQRGDSLWTFGSNQLGQLGLGEPTFKTPGTGGDLGWSGLPVHVAALAGLEVKDIAAGESQSVLLSTDGRLWLWGSQEDGEVITEPHLCALPETLTEPIRFETIACGAHFSLALDSAGAVWSWGNGEGGVLGLGLSHLHLCSAPLPLTDLKTAGAASSIACGAFHALAVCASSLYTWGRAEGGQLGLPEAEINAHVMQQGLNDTFVSVPSQITFGKNVSGDEVAIKEAAGGDVHSLALDSTGRVWAWGWGEFGQLGLGFAANTFQLGRGGATARRAEPEALASSNFMGKGAHLVACGGGFSAALVKLQDTGGGSVFMWGANEVGQCGLPPKGPMELVVPTKVDALGSSIVALSCGGLHALAVDTGGHAYSWGLHSWGQLGRDRVPRTFSLPPALTGYGEVQATCLQPMRIARLESHRVRRLACGLHHSMIVSEPVSPGAVDEARDVSPPT